MTTNHALTLRQLNLKVRDAIATQLPDEYWVEAELSECRERGGHCYMELIEKDEHTSTPVARASARCWRQTWQVVQPYFERTTGQPLRAGMKVLLCVYAQYHEAYGFSWIVTDIDPTYTLGDMARRRQEIIRQLKAEGVFDLQRELALPLFAQRIAVISAAGAAGYGDMQGEQVEQSIIAALNDIYRQQLKAKSQKPFDVVVIIRGGGATADLSGFDTLALAENVAQFPLPVITGIGHDRDESILDLIAHTRLKTPTAAATFLIDHLKQTADRIDRLATLIPSLAQRTLSDARHRLQLIQSQLPYAVERLLTSHRHRLQQLELRLQNLDPQLLLRRGYSITLKDGHIVRSPHELQPGDQIETRLEKGTIKSTVL